MAGVTFKVADNIPNVVRVIEHDPNKHYLVNFNEYQKENCGKVLKESLWSHGDFYPIENGFVNGILHAYNKHHNLVIRPDDVWLAIIVQFGIYVNANAESMRSIFVEHEGKKELNVNVVGSLHTADYGWFACEMGKELKKNLKDHDIYDWILPKFSTTTIDDTIVGSVAMMATMKKYFDYKCTMLCGIPYVTLAGTVEDWEEIHNRVDKLANYGEDCSKWAIMLKTITNKLVQTSKKNIDLKFWSEICHHIGFGSGPRYLSGWISTFCVFDSHGKWQANNFSVYEGGIKRILEFPVIDINDIPPGYLTVDVLIDDNGIEYKSLMFSGHMGYEIVDQKKGISPKLGWAIVLKEGESCEKTKVDNMLKTPI